MEEAESDKLFMASAVTATLPVTKPLKHLITNRIKLENKPIYPAAVPKPVRKSLPFCSLFCSIQSKNLSTFTPPKLKLIHFRSEEHTSELQSRFDLVCRLLLEKKKNNRECRR